MHKSYSKRFWIVTQATSKVLSFPQCHLNDGLVAGMQSGPTGTGRTEEGPGQRIEVAEWPLPVTDQESKTARDGRGGRGSFGPAALGFETVCNCSSVFKCSSNRRLAE